MIIKQLLDEDFVNYKKPAMFIAFPTCTFKCEKECGLQVCQNSTLVNSIGIDIEPSKIIYRYIDNAITSAIVMGGLEPFDSWDDLLMLVTAFRTLTMDDIVIYTGYYKEEILDKVNILSKFKNIVIKFGRYIPNQKEHYDKILGISLASDNQYAERIG